MKPKMYLVCGLSGSGKTEFAVPFAKEHNLMYFCPDDFYALINGDECIHENEFEVWITMYQAIHLAEKQGKDIVVDTDAPSYSDRRQFIDWFPSFEHHMICIEADKKFRRICNQTRRRTIPEDQLDRQEKRWEFIDSDYEKGWKSFTFIRNNGEDFLVRTKIEPKDN